MSRIGRMPSCDSGGRNRNNRREQFSDCKRSEGTLERELPVEMNIKDRRWSVS